MANIACRFTTRDWKGSFFSFFLENRTKNTHTQKHTPQRPTQRRNSKDLLQRSLTPALPRRGDDVTNTDSFVIVVQQRTVSLSFVVVPWLLKVLFLPLSLRSSELPVASSFLSSISKNNKVLIVTLSNGKNVNILQGCLAWRYCEACLRAEPCSWRGVAAVY